MINITIVSSLCVYSYDDISLLVNNGLSLFEIFMIGGLSVYLYFEMIILTLYVLA